jgi:hypothetical protein
MSEDFEPTQTPDANDLQFEQVEAITVAERPQFENPTCAACGQPFADAYYTAGAKLICPRCRNTYMATFDGDRAARFAKATFLGIVNGLLGAAIWCAARNITHLEIGLVAVLVGFLVGRGVLKGSVQRGGREYQILAVILTYLAMCASYIPTVLEVARRRHSLTYDYMFVWSKVVLKMPVLVGMRSPLTLLIAGFALWEAWKLNNRRAPKFAGPYSIAIGGIPGAQGVTSR